MKSTKLFLCLFFLFFFKISTQAQTDKTKSFKYGKIDVQEFDTKVKGQDSAAAAIKLFDIGKGHFEISLSSGHFVYVFERHVRYKVNNKNAYDLADLEIYLYTNNRGREVKLSSIKGATYNLNNGKIETNKLAGEAKFSNKLDKNYIVKKFTLPNVKEGSILEYSYVTQSDFTYTLEDWYFQGAYPCKFSSLSITLPEYFHYKIAVGGYVDIRRADPEDFDETYILPSQTGGGSRTVTARASRSRYYAEDIPSIKDESYITTLQDYVSKIGFELASTTIPGSVYEDYSSTWPKVVTEMMKEEKFGTFIRRDNYEKGFVENIIKDAQDPEIKMNLIFNYLKYNMKWDGKYSYSSTLPSQRAVLEKKSGNSADINLCLLGMLKAAGLESYPVLVSTRKNGAHPGYPLETKFNNVIVQVKIADKTHLLDAIDKHNVADMVSFQNLNHQGLKIKPASIEAEWIPIENPDVSRSLISYSLKLDAENKFSGTVFRSSSNYEGVDIRKSYLAAANQAEFLKTLKSSRPGLEIKDYKIENLEQPELPLQETMTISIEDNVEEAGNLIYFMPLLYDRTKENPFSLEVRNFPVDFAYPFEENYRMVIDFPANYKLEKLPKNEAFALPGDDGTFSITYVAEENKIAIKSKIAIKKPVFTAEEYFTLKELYKNIVRKQAEQIVFKKL